VLVTDSAGRRPPLVLAAHGSRDPASSATMRAVAARAARAWPAPVVAAFLDFDRPSIPDTLVALGRYPAPVVVPALLTNAYHGRVDLPAVLAGAACPSVLAEVLGPDPLLVTALRRRVSELDITAADGLVLLAAGTSDAAARSTVEHMAAQLGRRAGMPCVVGYASAYGPTPGEAVVAARAAGANRVVAASYFLAPGRLYTAAADAALQAGAVGVAAPLGAADELVRLVLARAAAAVRPSPEGTKKAPVCVPGRFSSFVGA
jgi:sirohydrochlorin ferrochelatase